MTYYNSFTLYQKSWLYLLLLVISILLCFSSCDRSSNSDIEFSQPEYIDAATDQTSRYRVNNNFEGALNYLDSIRRSRFENSLADQYYIYYLYYDLYNRSARKTDAIHYIDSMMLVLDQLDDKDLLYKEHISVNYYKADILFGEKDYDEAYQYYYNALSLSQQYNDSCDQYYYYLILAHVLYKSDKYSDALKYYKTAGNLLGECSSEFWTFYRKQQSLNNIGLCYEKLQNYDSSIIYFDQALQVIDKAYTQFSKDKYELIDIADAVVSGNLGSVYVKVGESDTAEKLLISSIRVNEVKGRDVIDAQFNRIKLANLYINTNRVERGKEILDTVRTIADTIQNKTVEMRWNRAMSNYLEKKDDKVNAYQYLMSYTRLSDTMRNEQADLSMADIDNRVNSIAAKYQIEALQESADMRKVYLSIALVISILALVIALLVMQNLSKSKRHVRILKTMNERINVQKARLKETYDELESTGGEKDRILKAVSHDLRSPINSSLALIDLIQSDADNLTEDQKEYLSLIRNSSNNALSLTKDLLEAASIDRDGLEKELVDINSLLTDTISIIRYRAAEKSQTISLSLPQIHVSAHVHKEKIQRVITNLVTNAIKFSPADSTIQVEMIKQQYEIMIAVKDSGIGIPDSMKDKIFDLFTEAKRFGTSGEQPYGLGLSISKQIVEAHGGSIEVESKEGHGTSFYIHLPMDA